MPDVNPRRANARSIPQSSCPRGSRGPPGRPRHVSGSVFTASSAAGYALYTERRVSMIVAMTTERGDTLATLPPTSGFDARATEMPFRGENRVDTKDETFTLAFYHSSIVGIIRTSRRHETSSGRSNRRRSDERDHDHSVGSTRARSPTLTSLVDSSESRDLVLTQREQSDSSMLRAHLSSALAKRVRNGQGTTLA